MQDRGAWLLAGVVFGASACGGAESPPSEPGPAPRASAPADQAWTPTSSPEVTDVLAALRQSHAALRTRIGPHRLRYTAEYALRPTEAVPALPEVGSGVFRGEEIRDAVELTWVGEDDDGPTFSLSQHNDKDRGRDVVITGGTVYARLEHRPYMASPLETDLHELWLDDAQHAAYDALAFAAPRLALRSEVKEGAGFGGGDALELELGLAEAPTGLQRLESSPRSGWRERAELTALQGTLRLDRATGAWMSLELDAAYRLAEGERSFEGSLRIEGSVEQAEDAAAAVQPPPDAVPLALRTRREVERDRILDGLAAP